MATGSSTLLSLQMVYSSESLQQRLRPRYRLTSVSSHILEQRCFYLSLQFLVFKKSTRFCFLYLVAMKTETFQFIFIRVNYWQEERSTDVCKECVEKEGLWCKKKNSIAQHNRTIVYLPLLKSHTHTHLTLYLSFLLKLNKYFQVQIECNWI